MTKNPIISLISHAVLALAFLFEMVL